MSSLAEEAALSKLWRGNVRELRNAKIERAVNLATGAWLMPGDLLPNSGMSQIGEGDPILPLATVRDAAEKRQIERVLRGTGGQIGEAAKRLKRSRAPRCGKRCTAIASRSRMLASDDRRRRVRLSEPSSQGVFGTADILDEFRRPAHSIQLV